MSEEILSVLADSPFLRALPDKAAQRLAGTATVRTFEPGDVIVEEGSTDAMTMWIIIDGEIEVRKGDHVITTMGKGAHIGEMALFADSGSPRTAGIVAKTRTRAFRIPSWDLIPLVEAHPEVAMAVIRDLARRLQKTTAQLG
ncbi:MAG TPA: Crp/Fnr family transcriptional regulator [Acidimicrobiia bacterium]|jgi:CRP-like cAMP-binding protein